jgi:hypothetical protein
MTSLCVLANTLGIIIGFVFPTFFVDDVMDDATYKDGITNYLWGQFIINIVFCIPIMIFMKNKPEIPPR